MEGQIVANTEKITILTKFVVLISALAGCLYGLDIGIIGGALPFINKEMMLTPGEEGMIVGAVLAGTTVSILVAGFLSDFFGRKKIIIASGIVFVIGVFLSSTSHDFLQLLSGRIVMGVGVGLATIVVPLFLSEATPAKIRGTAVACFQLFLTAGILFAYLIGLAFTKSGNWRMMFDLLAIPGILFFLLSFILPDSPSWLFMKKKNEQAKKILCDLQGDKLGEEVYQKMLELEKMEKASEKQSVFKKKNMLPFMISFFIAILTQTTGINSVLQYAPKIFSDAGASSNVLSMILGTGVTVINLITTFIAMMLIDRLGRKPLLIFSTGGVVVSLILIGISFHVPFPTLKLVLLTVGMFGFIFSYAIGIGVAVWLATSELLPAAIRAKGMAIALFANSAVSTIIATVFVKVQVAIGYANVFFALALLTFVYFVIVVFILPETKGKTIEEIEEYFASK